jgi:hypothetical protein
MSPQEVFTGMKSSLSRMVIPFSCIFGWELKHSQIYREWVCQRFVILPSPNGVPKPLTTWHGVWYHPLWSDVDVATNRPWIMAPCNHVYQLGLLCVTLVKW